MQHSIVSFFLLLLLFSTRVQGQDVVNRPEARNAKGQLVISPTLGIRGLGSSYTTAKEGIVTLPVVLYVDYGLNDMVSVGFIGGVRTFQCDGCSDQVNGTFYSAGVRVNAHILPMLHQFTDIEFDPKKLDIYLSLMGGAELNSSITMIPRLSLGARYRILPKVSVLGEIGSGFLSMTNVGLSFHL